MYLSSVSHDIHANPGLGRRILDGIIDEISEYDIHQILVGLHDQPGGAVRLQADAFLPGGGSKVLEAMVDDFSKLPFCLAVPNLLL